MRLARVRATTAEWQSAYPWHFGGSIPSIGPVVGIDRLAGGSPFGIDPLELVVAGVATNPNMVIAGAPGNGKSAFVKALLWILVGAFGYRFVVTDVKGEYRQLATALGAPVLDLRPGGPTRVNPLQDSGGRLEFAAALGSLCVDRSLEPLERATLAAAVRVLPDTPLLGDLLAVLREMPSTVCDELVISRDQALSGTQALRFGLGELLTGALAGMFDGPSTITTTDSPAGFVVDVSGCGTDDRVLRFAMLAGQRAVTQTLAGSKRRTLRINDEGWRVASTLEGVRYMQHDFKLGRVDAMCNILVVHRADQLSFDILKPNFVPLEHAFLDLAEQEGEVSLQASLTTLSARRSTRAPTPSQPSLGWSSNVDLKRYEPGGHTPSGSTVSPRRRCFEHATPRRPGHLPERPSAARSTGIECKARPMRLKPGVVVSDESIAALVVHSSVTINRRNGLTDVS